MSGANTIYVARSKSPGSTVEISVVGDGSDIGGDVLFSDDDAATVIQAAVDEQAEQGGGVVHCLSGVYPIEESIRPRDGIAISGDGPGRTVFEGRETLDGEGPHEDHMSYPRASIISRTDPVSDLRIEGIEFDGSRMNHRETEGDDWKYSTERKAISLREATRLVIRNNYVHDVPATGIGNDFNYDTVVQNNVVENCGTVVERPIPGSNGIGIGIGSEAESMEGTIVTGNVVCGSANNNILLEGYFGNIARNFVIANNLVYESRTSGIRVDESSDFVITDNTVLDNAHHGILVTEVEFNERGTAARAGTVSDNVVRRNGRDGIAVPYPDSRDLVVSGNVLKGNDAAGLRIRSAGDVVLTDNSVGENAEVGVVIRPREAGEGYLVANNRISDSGRAGDPAPGIRLDGSDAPLRAVTVADNQISSSKADPTQSLGVRLSGDLGDVHLADNTFRGNQDAAVGGDTKGVSASNNVGYATEASGSVILPDGDASASVDHGLTGTPTSVTATGRHPETAAVICTDRNEETLVLSVPEPTSADRTVDWRARCDETRR